ncbi:leucine-rich repeat and calponin homology domain-containing protein 3 isoform X2 [Salarias fasciatus]|uniref:leucine-rich repeat and calponin homology domain-containing protein 3 isoform X2 n=1 Tax=Salarias fasciatus TaxID=181472 RepID=UPI001176BF5D|nr:leucine-rich repeat and calponin homology domain-containing protein 3 isoform X2 [Salarias fasciatus]
MAASVLLGSADTGLNFGSGGGGAVLAGNTNGLAPAGPAPWNRSVDRALDEAAATGSLNLSGRKLKEFPRSASNHDLTDITRADLSRNRLSELPLEVCVFVSVESLNLYQNCLRSLPDALINLQTLTYLNLSRNQLSVLPAVLCSLPLKVLIACNNKLMSLPENLGQLRHLTELDVSCNEIQNLPSQVGQLEALRDLNIRRNHLLHLPAELAELPLVRLDFSCNRVTSIPVCYRRLTQLQTMTLDNNPLQSPPAQICIKGKVHIFKYLNLQAMKGSAEPPEYERPPPSFSSCADDLYPGRLYGALDSGFNSVDSGDKRWLGNETSEEPSDRTSEVGRQRAAGAAGGPALANGTCPELEQMDFVDSCAGEEEEEGRRGGPGGPGGDSLSSQFMAYIERRITREGSPVKIRPSRTEDGRRQSRTVVDGGTAPPGPHAQRGGVERMRREAQLAALRYDEERQKTKPLQRDSSYSKNRAAQSPTKSSPEAEICPSRRSTHTDDSALFMGEDRGSLSPTANQSPTCPGSGGVASCRGASLRPESFLYRLGQREEQRRGERAPAPAPASSCAPADEHSQEEAAAPPLLGEEAQQVEQLRKNIEARLKVSLPSDLGAALTDGVVLCHLANHVRPRSVPSIHVPSPAVPKLTMAKCRRNVENFLEACRKMGVPQTQLCLPLHILEERGLPQVAVTVAALLDLAPRRQAVAMATGPSPPASGPSVTI